MNQPPKRVVLSPKRKKFAPAYDARRAKKENATDGLAKAVSDIFSLIYGVSHLLFVIGVVAGVVQLAYQTYTYASIHEWPAFSAFDLAKIMKLDPELKAWEPILTTFTPGALVATVFFVLMQLSNLFIKRASR